MNGHILSLHSFSFLGKYIMSITELPRSRKVNGKYQNTIETKMDMPFSTMLSIIWAMLTGKYETKPGHILNTAEFNSQVYTDAKDLVLFSWFGHSSLLVRFAGKNILFDPVFSPRASMFSFAGPKNFDYTHAMHHSKLPKIDMLVLSHDHYDHLDKNVIKAIHSSIPKIYAPLGVGKRLEKWGVPKEKITEADWWDVIRIDDGLEIVCTPSRHFSGRGLTDRTSTLWSSWVFLGESSRFYFSGDSGYSPEFKTIGNLYGPFDFAFMECGQYNELWEPIHMLPEQTAQAAQDVQSKLTVPIHWGKFALAMHTWTDSVKRFKQKADELGLTYFFPEISAVYDLQSAAEQSDYWWER